VNAFQVCLRQRLRQTGKGRKERMEMQLENPISPHRQKPTNNFFAILAVFAWRNTVPHDSIFFRALLTSVTKIS
jgi:hypothetical protein